MFHVTDGCLFPRQFLRDVETAKVGKSLTLALFWRVAPNVFVRIAVVAAAAALLGRSTSSDVKADFHAVLASSGIQIFSARLVGVPWQPASVERTLDSPSGIHLISNARHWLLLGKQYERQDGISLRSIVPATADLNHHVAALEAYRRRAGDRERWSNIALANAISGDLETAASMLETGGAFAVSRTRSVSAGMQSDVAAIRIQQFEMTGDVRFALKALVAADRAIGSDSTLCEAHFNRALALEKIGLGAAAAVSYSRALQNEHSSGWFNETSARIQNLSRLTAAQLWLRARSRLQRISALDAAFVAQTVRSLPRQARTAAEEEYLGRWALAVEGGDAISAGYYLDLARLIGKSLKEFSGELLLADAVLVIDKSNENRNRRSLRALARGHRLYLTAKSRAGSAAAHMSEEAAKQFEIAGSPMGTLARYFAATQSGSVYESYAAMRAIESRIEKSHIALRALVDAELGNDLAERGELYDAFNSYTRAERAFECLGEIEGMARMRSARAHMLTFLGSPIEAWRIRKVGLAEADLSGDLALIEDVIMEAALDETFERDDATAFALYGTVVHPPTLHFAGRFRFYIVRGPIRFPEAQTVLASIGRHPLRADVENAVHFTRAVSLWDSQQPRGADTLITQYIEYSRTTGRSLMLPYLLLYRANAQERMNDDVSAIADLRRSLSLLERRCEKVDRQNLRDICTVTADDVFFALSDLYWKHRADDRVFELGEERRGFVFMREDDGSRSLRALSMREIGERLPPGMALVVFTSSPTNTMATAIERGRIVTRRLRDATGQLLRKKRRIAEAVSQRRQEDALELAGELYDELIAPLALQPSRISRLVIVADRPLKDFPFAFLRDRRRQQYLVEQFELLHAPSASIYVQRSGDRTKAERHRAALTVGDPAFDTQRYPALSPLPAARDESARVARQYAAAPALTGQQATFRNLAERIGFADVVDIATHTARNATEPALADLILAKDGEGGSACTLQQITALPIKKGSTVVIAGCETAVSRDWGDLRDFAGAFLAAGAGNAVATLWDIEDEAARDFAVRFHAALNRGESSAAAVRTAQLSMLHSPNPWLREAGAWAGFQAYALGLTDSASHAP